MFSSVTLRTVLRLQMSAVRHQRSRYFSRKGNKPSHVLNPELSQYMHGRRNKERRDSITNEILLERKHHLQRLSDYSICDEMTPALKKMGFGKKQRRHSVYTSLPTPQTIRFGLPHHHEANEDGGGRGAHAVSVVRKSNVGAGGFARHLTSATQAPWPLFQHLLPEIVFAGHSNSGKSTLVNAMCGILPTKGPAKTSERAGWTDQICFYQLGKRPPLLTLVDLPGYGHAVASAKQQRQWHEMMKSYLLDRRIVSRCCVLVDCTRGLCKQDRGLIRFLSMHKIPWTVVLTKGDLMPPSRLSQCISLVHADLQLLQQKVTADHEENSTNSNSNGLKQKINNVTMNNSHIDGDSDTLWRNQKHHSNHNHNHDDNHDDDDDDDDDDDRRSESESSSDSDSESDSESDSDSDSSDEFENSPIPPTAGITAFSDELLLVSASSGAGVQKLWQVLSQFAETDKLGVGGGGSSTNMHSTTFAHTPLSSLVSVREHKRAAELRQRHASKLQQQPPPSPPEQALSQQEYPHRSVKVGRIFKQSHSHTLQQRSQQRSQQQQSRVLPHTSTKSSLDSAPVILVGKNRRSIRKRALEESIQFTNNNSTRKSDSTTTSK